MTVQELIDELNEIQNKDKVFVYVESKNPCQWVTPNGLEETEEGYITFDENGFTQEEEDWVDEEEKNYFKGE